MQILSKPNHHYNSILSSKLSWVFFFFFPIFEIIPLSNQSLWNFVIIQKQRVVGEQVK